MTAMASHNGVAPASHSTTLNTSMPTQPTAPSTANGDLLESPPNLERDYYGCYCLKFIVKNGSHITEEKVLEDFGHFGEVVDVRGPGLFSGLRGNHVYVRFIDKADAEEALRHLSSKYHQLTPASISDVLPDNYGLYTISFYNKTGIPSSEVRREFSKFGEVKNLTGSLDVKGGRVFVSYKEKSSAVPRCEKDYFGCYCLKFYNKSGDITEEKVLKDFGQFGEVVDVRGPGLFDVTGDDVYVRYKEKSSAEQALIELVGKYDSLCLAPPSDIQVRKNIQGILKGESSPYH
jgi:RNA recognition motif. (a.k.a. RRM, RBD, or RNP domain)